MNKSIFKHWKDYKEEIEVKNQEARRQNAIEAERVQKINDEFKKEYEEILKDWQYKKSGHKAGMPYTLAYGRPSGPIYVWYFPVEIEECISFEGYVKWLDKYKKI